MRVNEILTTINEDVQLNFDDLTSLQIAALRAVADGRLDFENASDRMLDVLYQLQDYNLLDDTFELTPTGHKAVDLAVKFGSSERRRAAAKKDYAHNVDMDSFDLSNDDSYPDDDFDDDGDDERYY